MKKREIRKIKKQLSDSDNKTIEIRNLILEIQDKNDYIGTLQEKIDELSTQIETMKRNVQNDYISRLTIERLIAELEPKQKFREIAILKELLINKKWE